MVAIEPGQIDWFSDPNIPPHPVVVMSREEFNRGDRVIVAIITSTKFAARCVLPNCVVLRAGQFGLSKECVVQAETVFHASTAHLDLAAGPIGCLDDQTFRDVIREIGYVLDADCEPC